MKKIAFIIKGTHCNACKILIEDVSMEVAGIKSCTVDFKTGNTEIEYDEAINWDQFKRAIEELGDYEVQISV